MEDDTDEILPGIYYTREGNCFYIERLNSLEVPAISLEQCAQLLREFTGGDTIQIDTGWATLAETWCINHKFKTSDTDSIQTMYRWLSGNIDTPTPPGWDSLLEYLEDANPNDDETLQLLLSVMVLHSGYSFYKEVDETIETNETLLL